LFDIENRINQATAEDVDTLTSATRRQTTILLWGTAGLLLLMLVIFWSTNRLVFKPLAMVVKALKAEASGIESVLLPEVHSQETAALVDSFTDMAKQVRKRQEDLEYQALHDALTGLPNRTLLQERITHDIHMARRDKSSVSLLILDLDRFKEINDTLGHHIGDILLVEVGQRLSSMIRTVDTIARLGGDEFAIVLTNTDEEGAINVANKLIHAMEQTVDVDELKLYVSMSIGIATYPQHGDDSMTLVQHADVAMYNAKRQQVGCCIYDSSEDSYSLMRLEMINDLRDAIESNQVELYFQPIIDLQNDMPCGMECLLRWKHSRYGYLPPEQVIELSEHTGLINVLTYWVLEKGLSKLKKLHDAGHEISMSINISVNNLKDPQFIEKVSKILQSSSFGDKLIIFEITESAMMLNPLRGAELLSQLDKMGVRVSIDDFGTGYSSLSYLKQLPVDELKIDRSFIAGMSHHNSDETIVRSTIELAHNLGLKVVAEGVETEDIRQQLQEWGCDKVQGFLYTRPVNLDALSDWLDQYQSK
jgi:diguanylate cyclase (GGDEF)-like protein